MKNSEICGYNVDVDEDGPFITPESDSGTSIMGGDTGIDAEWHLMGPAAILSDADDEAREATLLDIMVDELADEKMVEMGYENGVESEVYA